MADNTALELADEHAKLSARMREAELVHQMRVEGHSYARIAKSLRISQLTAGRLHREHLERLRELESLGALEASRKVQEERYETLLAAVWKQAMAGDLAAVSQCRQILDSITSRELKVTAMLTNDDGDGKTVTIVAEGSSDEYINALREMGQVVRA
jgi:hypothetical protein